MSVTTLVLIGLALAALAALPTWSYSTDWGYGPSAILGVLLAVVLLLFLLGRI